jgi:hypothetical protein
MKSFINYLCTFAVLACSTTAPTNASAPPVPSVFLDLYTSLNTDLVVFNTTLSLLGGGAPYPVLATGALSVANSNTGPMVINSGYLTTTVQTELNGLQALGVKAIIVEVSFPVLYEPFYSSQSEYQQYVNFYAGVAAAVRAAGLKLIVEDQCLSTGLAQSGWNPSPFYATLNWTQYQAARAEMARTLAQTMKPDYLIVMEEPDTEAFMSGQTNINTVSGATSMLDQILTQVRQSGVIGMQVGAGVGSWLPDFQSFIYSYTQQQCSASQPCITSPLDFIDMHVFPINSWGLPSNNNFLTNALTIASIAAAAHKPVTMAECWEWKVRNSEWNVLTSDQIMSRNAFSFWAPLDVYFIKTMQTFANYSQMIFMSPFDSEYFWAYLTYGPTTQNLTPAQIFAQVSTQSALGLQQSLYTSTAMGYYHSNVSPPDTTPPTSPGNLTGTAGTPTGAHIAWLPATDNVGVAGYHIVRDGVKIATTTWLFYQDSGLTQNTTYTYQVTAFDLAGNRSSPAVLEITTPNGSAPNPPGNLTAKAVSGSEMSLTWSPPTGNAPISSYLLYRGSSPTTMTQFTQLTGTTTSFNNHNLTADTKYYYGDKAASNGYTSAFSNIVGATTQ